MHGEASYDSVRGVTVFYGFQRMDGLGTGSLTYEWTGNDWSRKSPQTRPTPHAGTGMWYDARTKQTMLFGGLSGTGTVHGSTWAWNGLNWSVLSPLTNPGPRSFHAVAHDKRRDQAVMFGGRRFSNATARADTWTWNGKNWRQMFPTTSPSARYGHSMAWDSKSGLTWLFGGIDKNGRHLSDTWVWNGSNWALIVASAKPAARAHASMIFDPIRGSLLLYGGSNGSWQRDTWRFVPGPAPSYKTFGDGCAGARGKPYLSTRLGELPYAGRDFSVQLNNLPLTGPAWMFLGASKSMYGGLRLPFDLGLIGMRACTLYSSADLLFPVTNVLGVGLWRVRIPSSFSGKSFFNQAIIFDPKANSVGLSVSNAGEAKVGG